LKYPSPLGEKLSTRITWAKKIKRGRENGENVKEKEQRGKGKREVKSKIKIGKNKGEQGTIRV
jgi:hypothetical protein